LVDQYQRYVGEVKEALDCLPWESVRATVRLLHEAWLRDKQVFIFGNGGSATTASHMACDLAKGAAVPGRRRFRVIALTDNMALLSAYANDVGYADVFAEQLANLVRAGDLVIALSASGESPNVIKGVELARAAGATSIGWTGLGGGRLGTLVDVVVEIPTRCVDQVENVHLILEHLVTRVLRDTISSDGIDSLGDAHAELAERAPLDEIVVGSDGTTR
jgi:D-sedoheptulose 7-phosphate isomerase